MSKVNNCFCYQAQAITLTVAQAFNCAKDDYEEKERKERENNEKVRP